MLKSLFRPKPKRKVAQKREKHELLAIDGETVAIHVRFNPRSRRMVMRVHPVSGHVTVTAPVRTGMAAALAFVKGEAGWVAHQRDKMPSAIALLPGTMVPLEGVAHHIFHSDKKGPAPVWREGDKVFVSGKPEHARRRLTDFFKREAKRDLEARSLELGRKLGVRPSRVMVRDTASRWGSCSTARALSYCWRLIFAPEFVRHYVVAHEVAHLKEMNHSPRFWAHVQTLDGDAKRARKWLREHGRDLLRYN